MIFGTKKARYAIVRLKQARRITSVKKIGMDGIIYCYKTSTTTSKTKPQ